MEKFFINEHSIYGFDLDGTLYDEFEFIYQTYKGISQFISDITERDFTEIHEEISRLWLTYGSSRTDLFQMFFSIYSIEPKTEYIKKCIEIYRTEEFKLKLPMRTTMVLSELKKRKIPFFLLTDGDSSLQRRKIKALGLDMFILEENIFISGDYGKEYQKPNTLVNEFIRKRFHNMKDVIYFGDRDVDEQYARNSEFSFQRVKCMIPF